MKVIHGYCTEKIMDAFKTKTIPIYYGDKNIESEFNKNSFINCNNKKDIDKVIGKIKKIDNNDDLYLKIINEKIFLEENYIENTKKELESFLINIIETKKKQVPNSLEVKRNINIIKNGSKLLNLKHKIHKIKVEKWK